MTVYFLGGGNMAGAIIAGLHRISPETAVHVVDNNADRRRFLNEQYGAAASDTLPELTADDVLVLAVKPQDMETACAGIRHNGALVLSVAAGLPVATLSRYLGGTQRIVRVMPNTPAQVGEGISGLFAGSGTSEDDRCRAEAIMGSSGRTLWLDTEAQMHAITGISGSGPAYVFYLLDALQQAAQNLGFDPQQARTLSLATFKGAVALAEQSGEDFRVLQDKVTSKGGTTFAALESFRSNRVAENLQQGAAAAATRSEEMANQFA